MTYLDEIVTAQKNGLPLGITSICSAHPTVLETALLRGLERQTPLLLEATCNQVNQYGGYTGMKPVDFVRFMNELADRVRFPRERLILGGDHLGPEVWKDESAGAAMGKARTLVRDYVLSGFTKIHLDASMKLAGDPDGPQDPHTAAARTADLARVAEEAFNQSGLDLEPRYVIGTEVPVPGGARGDDHGVQVTRAQDAAETIELTRQAFYQNGLDSAWERVIALVVQPGVEFGDDFLLDYDRAAAAELSRFIEGQDLVYEAHSTDYQTHQALSQMVADHFTILKVGPALTYAYREAVFALALIEEELFPGEKRSRLVEVIDRVMAADPRHWEKYYHGDPAQQRFSRKYSFSDRLRYYWTNPEIQAALEILFVNLGVHPIPLSLLSQYLPAQYSRVRGGDLTNAPRQIIIDKIGDVLRDYESATHPQNPS